WWKRTSRRPQRCQAASNIASMSAARVTSAATACWPRSAASFSAAPRSTSAMSTRAPSAANRLAHAAPIPLAPPVINTVRPAKALFVMPGIMALRPRRNGQEDAAISRSKRLGGERGRPPSDCETRRPPAARMLPPNIWYDDGHVAAARRVLRGDGLDDWLRLRPANRDRGADARTSASTLDPDAERSVRDDTPARLQQLCSSTQLALRSRLHRAAVAEVRDTDQHRAVWSLRMGVTGHSGGSRADGMAQGSGLVRAGVHHRVGRTTTISSGEAAAFSLIG